MFRSDLFVDPNPLATRVRASLQSKFLAPAPPVNTDNPLSVAQYNGYVDGATRAGTAGIILGLGLGFAAFVLYKRFR